MASPYIAGADGNTVYQRLRKSLGKLRDAVDELDEIRNVIEVGLKDTAGSTAAHFAAYQVESGIAAGGYADANAAAKASFDELASLAGKLTTDAEVVEVKSAIGQACAKHGV